MIAAAAPSAAGVCVSLGLSVPITYPNIPDATIIHIYKHTFNLEFEASVLALGCHSAQLI